MSPLWDPDRLARPADAARLALGRRLGDRASGRAA